MFVPLSLRKYFLASHDLPIFRKCSAFLSPEAGLHLGTVFSPVNFTGQFCPLFKTQNKSVCIVSEAFPVGGGLALVRLYIALYVTDLVNAITSSRK